MAWIESHQDIETHPKTLDLMAFMEWDLDKTIGKLHRFWWWCLKYAEDGDLRKHNDDRLAQAVGVSPGESSKRFIEAMVRACWLDREPYFRVHDWWEYAGMLLQIRYKHDSKKWKKVRSFYVGKTKNGSSNSSNNSTPTNQTNQPDQPNQTNHTKGRGFFKPTPEEVTGYAKTIGFELDGGSFCDHYEAKGWVIGKSPMRSWQAAVRTWKKNQKGGSYGGSPSHIAGHATPKLNEPRITD